MLELLKKRRSIRSLFAIGLPDEVKAPHPRAELDWGGILP